MFDFARRPEQRPPIGAPGISEEQYERITARLRGSGKMLKRLGIPALKFEGSSDPTINEGTR